jgi:hypothetical protein
MFSYQPTSSIKKSVISKALVAHICNPRYLGGRDQEDSSSNSALAKSS